ncbi:MAG: hypothetical protein HRU06_01180 [Oceanospirillaceae bacterium]|nr:hypothetical protein [Oceanospirillaceae bacterium]
MNDKFKWDHHSDQPYQLADKSYKKAMKKKHRADIWLLLVTNLFYFPLALIAAFFIKGKKVKRDKFFGLCVNLDKGDQQQQLIAELGCQQLQIRLPLADIDNLDKYVAFREEFAHCEVLINVLQDRNHIENHSLLLENTRKIFNAFAGSVATFQIGNAINRTKWGFFSVAEYLSFYQQVQQLRDSEFPDIKLVGPAVIDYEYHFTIRALFNGYRIKFDKLAALLYVDRRGAPENTQTGIFDTTRKIDFLYALAKLSGKSSDEIIISEANWPLSNTAPWAPTSETECIDEEDYANYLLRYYLLAFASDKVESVYWHQLIASGYGLVDAREGLVKRGAFYVFKTMLAQLQGSCVVSFRKEGDAHHLICSKADSVIEVLWNSGEQQQSLITEHRVIDKMGEALTGDIFIGQSPIYLIRD